MSVYRTIGPLAKSLIASDSSNTQTSFDAVFLNTFPDVAANYQSRVKELTERENSLLPCKYVSTK